MNTTIQEPNHELWRLPTVKAITTLSEPTIYRLMKLKLDDGGFPRPLKLGALAVAWRSDEILSWIESRERSNIGNTVGFYG